jgi:hypothetical protein
MGRGRPTKSKDKKDLQGTSRKDREAKSQTLASTPGKLGLPRGLHENIKRKCAGVARYLESAGAPIKLIRPLFERYCLHLQFAYDAAWIMKKGAVDDEGRKKPEAQVWRDESAAASKLEGQIMNILKSTKAPKAKSLPLKHSRRRARNWRLRNE